MQNNHARCAKRKRGDYDERGFYGVRRGRRVGVFDSWVATKPHVHEYAGACFKKFQTWQEAATFAAAVNEPQEQHDDAAMAPQTISQGNKKDQDQVCNNNNSINDNEKEQQHCFAIIAAGISLPQGDARTIARIALVNGTPQKEGIITTTTRSMRIVTEPNRGTDDDNEYYATLIAISAAYEYFLATSPPLPQQQAIIYTPSLRAYNAVTRYLENWARSGWTTTRGQPVAHARVLSRIYTQQQQQSHASAYRHNGDDPATTSPMESSHNGKEKNDNNSIVLKYIPWRDGKVDASQHCWAPPPWLLHAVQSALVVVSLSKPVGQV